MIKFEKPDYKIIEYQENNHYAKFEIEPLERGFGRCCRRCYYYRFKY